MEEERDTHLDEEEREKRSAVVRTQGGYAYVDETGKTTDEVTRGDDKRARIEEEVPDVTTIPSHQDKPTIRKVVACSKQPAKADSIENPTHKSAKAPNVPRKKFPALDTGNFKVLRSSQLDYTIVARQERETCELTFRLLPMLKLYQFPRANKLLPGPRRHQRKLDSLTLLPSPAEKIVQDTPDSATPGPLQPSSKSFTDRNFLCSSKADL